MIVADQTAIGFAAELSVFLLVDLLEDRALIPGGALELLQGAPEFALRDVHHPDFQHLVGFGVVDEVLEAAPGGFQPLKVLMVQDYVDLRSEEHTSELQSLMRISYAVFCLKKNITSI